MGEIRITKHIQEFEDVDDGEASPVVALCLTMVGLTFLVVLAAVVKWIFF